MKLVKERNYGIDLLRMFSMLMIVALHVLGQGGILDAAAPGSLNYWVAWFLEAAMYSAADCFALISGYALSVKNTKISSIISLWLQTLFYSVGITVLFFFFVPDAGISKTDILIASFPVITKRYWYISAYFGMYVVAPILNVALINMKKRSMEFVFIGMLIVLGGFSLKFDPFNLGGGCSSMWLCMLYLLGGYLRKYDIISKFRSIKGWALFGSMSVITFLSKFIIETFTNLPERNADYPMLLVSFVSPTVLLAGVGLFVVFARMKFPKSVEKIISIVSPAALGVYLIHVCDPIWNNAFKGFSAGFVNYSPVKMVFMVIGSSVAIYVACSAIELVRIYLFKALRINVLCSFAGDKIRVWVNRFLLRFEEDKDFLTK